MPTDVEVRVMRMLAAIEVPANAPEIIETLGTEAVTVVCEAALGSYPGLRPKLRTNAVAVVGRMTHPQARETLALLITDESPGVAMRALRAAGRRKDEGLVDRIGAVLRRPTTDELTANEAIRALRSIDSTAAARALDAYAKASGDQVPHRRSALVERALRQSR
jgi:HEAT repeat protein